MDDQTIEIESVLKSLPENLLTFVDPKSPHEQRLMAARGFVPLEPQDLATVLFCLTLDGEQDVRSEAEKSLNGMPENVMNNVLLEPSTLPELIDYVSRNSDNELYAQSILLNSNTLDSTYAYLAETQRSRSNLDIIANNRQRIIRSEAIVEALSLNPSVSSSTLDSVLSYISHSIEKTERATRLADSGESTPLQEDFEKTVPIEVETDTAAEPGDSFLDEIELPNQLTAEVDVSDAESKTQKPHAPLDVGTLSVGQKIKLALVGNMEARKALISSQNRMITSSVLRNPRLTEAEVTAIAQSKIVDENILRKVGENKKWTKNYKTKLSLVKNPKTPVNVSLKFLIQLNRFDLKSLQSNRNIPSIVSQTAKKLQGSRR